MDDITVETKQAPIQPDPAPQPPIDPIPDLTNTNPVKTETTEFNLDFLGGPSEKTAPPKPESKPKEDSIGLVQTPAPTSAPVQMEPEFLADDSVWLNERELDNSGRDGLKVFGKWFLKLKSKLFLKMTIWNKNANPYRSPRLDIKDNYYNILFLKEGVGIPLKSLKPGEFITLEKGAETSN